MQLEIIGVITLLAAVAILWLGPGFGIYATTIATIFGAAAAVKLPSLGDASVPPAPLIAGFLAIAMAMDARLRSAALQRLLFPSAGFWLMAFTAYALVAAFFLPRIFENMSHVYVLARNDASVGIVTMPLAPRASNVTQSAYLLINLVCFACVAGYAVRGGALTIARAVLAASTLILIFAAADLVTYFTGTADLLSVIRNANYRILDDGEIGGLKRIIGSFSEAGAYSYAALGCYAFALSLWFDRVKSRLTGLLALMLGLTLLLSTSTTAYFALAIHTALLVMICVASLRLDVDARRRAGPVLTIVGLLVLAGAIVVLVPSVWNAVSQIFDATVVNKLTTQSGVERLRWNEHAFRAFLETSGLGAGTGSVRASSLIFAALANVGVLGFLLVGAFLCNVLGPAERGRTLEGHISRAGLHACFVLTSAACISSGSVDLGLFFSVFAALAVTRGRVIKYRTSIWRFHPRAARMVSPVAVVSATSRANVAP